MKSQEHSLFVFKKEYETIIYELSKGEGSEMTFAQTSATINNQTVKAKPSDVSLVRNIQKGLEYVLTLVESQQMEFSKYHLCAINSLVANDDNKDNLGSFRLGEIRIGGAEHTGVNPLQALDVFERLHDDFHNSPKENSDIIKLSLDLCKHQFFGDGNKRSAQLMMDGLLVQKGFMPFVLNFKKEENIEALIKYYDDNDIKPLYEFFLRQQYIIAQAYSVPTEK